MVCIDFWALATGFWRSFWVACLYDSCLCTVHYLIPLWVALHVFREGMRNVGGYIV